MWALKADFAKRLLATGGDDSVRVWHMDKKQEEWTARENVEGATMCMDMEFYWSIEKEAHAVKTVVGTADGIVQVYARDLKEGKNGMRKCQGHRGPVAHVHANFNLNKAITGAWDGQLKIWAIDTERTQKDGGKISQTINIEPPVGRIRALCADFEAADGVGRALVGTSNGTIHMVELDHGSLVDTKTPMDAHVGAVTALQVKKF